MPPSSRSRPRRRAIWILNSADCLKLSTEHLRMVGSIHAPADFHDGNNSLAGIPLPLAAKTATGVYVGCFTSDYNGMLAKDMDVSLKYAGSGTIASMLSNRVSWFFDFQGPSITIDTACSSSLVAAHQACLSLKQRETNMVRMVSYSISTPC